MRYYLHFSPDLLQLLEHWEIGMIGPKALRSGFCTRSLVYRFAYVRACIPLITTHTRSQVWTDQILLSTFVQASLYLLIEHPHVKRLGGYFKRLGCKSKEEDLFAATARLASDVEAKLVNMMCTVTLVLVFGCWVPSLLLFAPVFVMVNM